MSPPRGESLAASPDASRDAARRARGSYTGPIAAGLLIVIAGLVPWTLLARANLRLRPDLPWAAVATVGYLAVLTLWLHGWGPPRATAGDRRVRLRLWPPLEPDPGAMRARTCIAMLTLIYLVWIAMGLMSPVPTVGEYPTTAYRWSLFLMGGLTAGVVEEVAFRGYMQTGLERLDPANAIWITSLVFVLTHVTQGIGTMLVMAPGLFIASVLYGMLARRTGTILPGLAIHVLGDLARVYFGVLHGDHGLLFA